MGNTSTSEIFIALAILILVAIFIKKMNSYRSEMEENEKAIAAKEKEAFRALPIEERMRIHKEAEQARKESDEKIHQAYLKIEYGEIAPKVICPHCQTTGMVRRKIDTNSDELVLAKNHTYKAKVVEITKMYCENCETKWNA
jgi:hypothetical protein